jgi:hypothetical protein
MRLLKRIWDDVKKGENIDLYVTVVVAFGLVLLDLIGFAPQNWLSSIILAVLGLIAISTLGNRYRLEELSHKLTQSNELFLDEFPARLKDDFEAGTEVWLVGVTLARTVKTYYVAMERKIRKGHIIKVLLVHPEGPPIEMAETRIYGRMDVQRTIGDIRNTLQDLCDLRAIAPDRLQIRTIKNPLAYGAIAINPDSPLGAAQAQIVGRLDRHRRTRRMKRTLIVFLLVNLMLPACAPAPTSTPAPSAIPSPNGTAAPTRTPTATPTAPPTPIPTIRTPTTTTCGGNPPSGAQLYLKNPSFEETVPDKDHTLDPADWLVTEGKTRQGTHDVIEEMPELVQVVGAERQIRPCDGNKMLKIDARLTLKSSVIQYYPEPISAGRLIQELAVHPTPERVRAANRNSRRS